MNNRPASPAYLTRRASLRLSLDDYWDGAAVHAPRGARHVGRALRAEEDDRRSDLADFRKPADRPALAGFGERLVGAGQMGQLRRLVREAAGPDPQLGHGRAGTDRIHEHAVSRQPV